MAPLAPWEGSTKLFGKATLREIKIDNCIFQQEVVFCVKLKWRALLMQSSPQIFYFLQPDPNEKNYSSGSKDWLDPKQDPKLEFVHCQKVYKKRPIRTLKGPCQALFVQGSPKTFFCITQPWKKKYSFGTKGRIELNPL